MRKRNVFIVLGLVGVAALLLALKPSGHDRMNFTTEPVGRGEIRAEVEATGTVNAVTTVQVGSQVSGTIASLSADFNSRVSKGEVIARIEPSLLQASLLQAEADFKDSEANVAAARANVEKARASERQLKADFERSQELTRKGVTSPKDLDAARANAESAEAVVAAAKAQLLQAEAQVSQRQAAVELAQTNLTHSIIRAPIDGTVVARNVDVGQTVAASLQAPVLFTIAQDLKKMQVYAKTDESDVGGIRRGQKVSFRVDAFPDEVFSGRVEQVRLNATTVQNVVTYDTVVDFDNPDLRILPGMTAYVTIPVAVAQNALKVPNSALRFKPDLTAEQLKVSYAREGISDRLEQHGSNQAQSTAKNSSPESTLFASPNSRDCGAVVWKPDGDGIPRPAEIRTGVSDRTYTQVLQVLHGELNDGDLVVTSSTVRPRGRSASPPAEMPGLGGPPRK